MKTTSFAANQQHRVLPNLPAVHLVFVGAAAVAAIATQIAAELALRTVC